MSSTLNVCSSVDLTQSNIRLTDNLEKRSWRERSKGFIKQIKLFFRETTVEPCLFLYMLSTALSSLAVQNMHLEKSCRVNFGFGDEICDRIRDRNTTGLEEEVNLVQSLVARVVAWKFPLQTAIPAVMALFIGAWSDKTKKRKICILFPFTGEIIANIGLLFATYYFYELSLTVTALIEALPAAFTGSYIIIFMGMYSFMADRTTVENRTFRLGLVTICVSMGTPTGTALSGVLLRTLGYYGVFSLLLCLHIISVLYGILRLEDIVPIEETKSSVDPSSRISVKKKIKEVFGLVANTVMVAVRPRAFGLRPQIFLVITLYIIMVGPLYGDSQVSYLYAIRKFNFNEVEYSVYGTINIVLGLIDAIQKTDTSEVPFMSDGDRSAGAYQFQQEAIVHTEMFQRNQQIRYDSEINYLDDLITLEDLIEPVRNFSKTDLMQPYDIVMEERYAEYNIEDCIFYDDLSDASTIGTIVLVEIFNDSWRIIQEKERIFSKDIVALMVLNIFDQAWKIIKPKSRWRLPDPSSWSSNIIKKRRAEGLPYVTAKKTRQPKVPKPVDCSKCTFKCLLKFTDDDREQICRKYWRKDFVNKKNFILRNIQVQEAKTRCVVRKRLTARTHNKKYFFQVNYEKTQVCQNFFCKTLCISSSVVNDAVKNRDPYGQYSGNIDPRGRKSPPNKTPPEKLQEVRDHISSFPTMESHYVRKDIRRRYLDYKLSINKMYQLYVEECEKKRSLPVSDGIYRKVLCTEYNYGFYVPKKDQCLLCTKYNRLNIEGRAKMEEEYQQHIQRKVACNEEKKHDKERAQKEETFITASFDLQAILQIPSGDVGQLYYKRKLIVYNLTIYQSAAPNEAYCFPWLETNGKKGSSEIGSILYYYLSQYVPKNVVEVSLFSDTCSGQNRNQYIAALLLWSVHKIDNLKMIEHKFMESGHSYMEVDSMHSAIENAHRHSAVFTMTEWLNIFKRARSSKSKKKNAKKPYHAKEMKFYDFKDLKKLASLLWNTKSMNNTDGERVKWLKIKRMRYVKGEKNIYYNYDMSENFHIIDVSKMTQPTYITRKGKLSKVDFLQTNLKQLYSEPLVISNEKKNDLISLCTSGVIPEEYHGWYQNLKSQKDCKERVPYEEIYSESEEDNIGSEEETENEEDEETEGEGIEEVGRYSGESSADEYLYRLA